MSWQIIWIPCVCGIIYTLRGSKVGEMGLYHHNENKYTEKIMTIFMLYAVT